MFKIMYITMHTVASESPGSVKIYKKTAVVSTPAYQVIYGENTLEVISSPHLVAGTRVKQAT